MGSPRQVSQSVESVTWTCTCGWVLFPELPHSATCSPTDTRCPGRTRTAPPQVHQRHEGPILPQRDDDVVAGDGRGAAPAVAGGLAEVVGGQGELGAAGDVVLLAVVGDDDLPVGGREDRPSETGEDRRFLNSEG
ncbi:hypothetical protein A605_08570 [Corynebacterium halotolerans YIM 70093 = DSM 44683]|uniref:Uncharacterized protein n=1 Tax=Corynebacterium halotolerans YIM 70093 = DSM 44683 TaxID=1121362 RepID=M1P7S0_9CORY|nr:hypothetical protein A605_08570 [Corynebacterium halotolerans YIM 70093 = DSM 44683]